ncbi:efflux transporter outer membrane subunit [Rugamonas rubra]|uniref:Efflux transporter, outer membrane factor (OMF) lipoprotein, NodT family n=1 Tax=Rugamonas rubra TaxID=758825 RepID=A0A1I4KXR1_9BURK|nr:efflux transporter outer membrane subunit [Rugamonas rubra]SFL83319.1 efflux transporter, outer membrane factor (OMF) lipoprotein, NodT family [Rugamonas rubra]
MTLIRTLTATALTLALAACADMGHVKPQAQQLKPAELNAGSAIAAADGKAAWPTQAWWESLHDPQLNQLVDAALADNPGLHATQARVRQARALAGVAEAATLPKIDANASADRELYSAHSTVPAPLAGNYAWKNTAALSGSYDLDLWGRNRDLLAAALGEVQTVSAESQMARLALQSAIVRSYIQLSLDYALQDTIVANLAQRQRILEITRRRQAAGLASDIDVSSIETTLPAGRRDHEQIGAQIALLRNQLAALIGKGPGDGEAIVRPTLALDHAAALPSALPAELLSRRPDIAAQRWRVEAAAQRIKAARADFYPNINLAAFAGFQSIGFSHLLDTHSAMRGVTPAISLPIFEGGRLRSQLGAQSAAYDGAVEQYNATVVQALAEVANAVTRAASAREQERLSRQALASARRAHALAEKAWRAGMTDSVGVINAHIALLNEEQQQAQIVGRQLDNYAELMAALGGGIKLDLP